MKRSLPIFIIATLITASCSDMFDKQIEIYEDAMEELDGIDEFPVLMNEALDTGTKIARVIAQATDKEREKLEEDYADKYEAMVDSVEKIRDDYYSHVDSLFLGYTYNFVERRILLYQMAADRYCTTENIEELNAIRDIIKRYSKLAFVESQRSCDPPARIREEYEAKKELAENCFDVAKKRILNEEEQ